MSPTSLWADWTITFYVNANLWLSPLSLELCPMMWLVTVTGFTWEVHIEVPSWQVGERSCPWFRTMESSWCTVTALRININFSVDTSPSNTCSGTTIAARMHTWQTDMQQEKESQIAILSKTLFFFFLINERPGYLKAVTVKISINNSKISITDKLILSLPSLLEGKWSATSQYWKICFSLLNNTHAPVCVQHLLIASAFPDFIMFVCCRQRLLCIERCKPPALTSKLTLKICNRGFCRIIPSFFPLLLPPAPFFF